VGTQITHKQIEDAVKRAIEAKLQKHRGHDPSDKESCTLIYQDIFLALQEIVLMIPTLKNGITDKGINFVAQAYYDMVSINGRDELNPNIFTERVKHDDMPTSELALCGVLLHGTPVLAEIVAVIKKRS